MGDLHDNYHKRPPPPGTSLEDTTNPWSTRQPPGHLSPIKSTPRRLNLLQSLFLTTIPRATLPLTTPTFHTGRSPLRRKTSSHTLTTFLNIQLHTTILGIKKNP